MPGAVRPAPAPARPPATARPSSGRRRGSHQQPRWAERFPDTPEGLDRLETHKQARRLPRHTDPDTIEDPDTRDAFLEQLQDDEHPDAARSSRGGGGAAARLGPGAGVVTRMVPDSVGSIVAGVVAYALVVNYVRGGWSQMRRWAGSKLTNGGGKLP